MSFWSVMSPVATIGASALGGPLVGAAVGAGTGALAANERRQQMLDRQRLTANAAADAQRVAWARRPGSQQFIPQVEYAQGTAAGDTMAGVMGGGMQGFAAGQHFGKNPVDWSFFKKSPTPALGYGGVAQANYPTEGF